MIKGPTVSHKEHWECETKLGVCCSQNDSTLCWSWCRRNPPRPTWRCTNFDIHVCVCGGLQREIGDQRHLAFAKFSPVTLRRLPPCPICKPGLLFCRLNDPEPLLSSVCQAHPELLFLQAPRVFLHLVHDGLVLEGRVDLHQVAAQAPAVVSCLKPTHCLVLEPVRKVLCQSLNASIAQMKWDKKYILKDLWDINLYL